MSFVSIIQSIFQASEEKLKIRFSESLKSWTVVKNYSILFVGSKEQCKNFLKNYKSDKAKKEGLHPA